MDNISQSDKEKEILNFWDENKIFEKSIEKNIPKKGWNFFKKKKVFNSFDGPPFANGLPHHGHLLVSAIKDSIFRYKNMKGYVSERNWGWDCHGLPVENEISNKLNISSKKEIEGIGVKKFVSLAKEGVFEYMDIWKQKIHRYGRWVDMDSAYKTLDSNFIESVWHIFSLIHKKGLVKKVFRVFHVCPSCETNLSNLEVTSGYKDIDSISVFVKFNLVDSDEKLVIWTTTPWTLPSNVAISVNKDIDYCVCEVEGEKLIVAKKLAKDVFGEKEFKVLEERKGSELIGLKYRPVFDYWRDSNLLNGNEYTVYGADYVTTEEGTGLVHTAPGFGEDDYNSSEKYDLPVLLGVRENGSFKENIVDFKNLKVKPKEDILSTDIQIIKKLSELGALLGKRKIKHSYPHCWRCDSPLINYAMKSWIIEMSKLKNKLLKNNDQIYWVPSHIQKGRFGNWLENVHDWSIARSRYWGSPIPIWEAEDGERIVVDSINTLKKYIKGSNNKYVFIRHGETMGNVEKKSWLKKEGCPLTKKGVEQAKSAGKKLKNIVKDIDLMFVSPFERTKETANLVSENFGYSGSYVEDERISEYGYLTPQYTGLSWGPLSKSIYKEINEKNDIFAKYKDFESQGELFKRVGDFMYDCEKKYKDKVIVIVSHRAVGMAIRLLCDGFSFSNSKDFISTLKNTRSNKDGMSNYTKNALPCTFDFKPLPHDDNYALDLHKPYIDDVLLYKNGKEFKRIEEIFDCWFESGSMPYASVHYPFNKNIKFDPNKNINFPTDFITEGIDQTRGWFNSLLSVSTAAFGKTSYKSVIATGLVGDREGKKLSKSRGNYSDPFELIDLHGADAFRFYLLNSPLVKGEQTSFLDEGLEDVRKKIVNRLMNCLSFYKISSLDKNDDFNKGFASTDILDRWVISRLNETTSKIDTELSLYKIDKACVQIDSFIEDLSTWYVRRSRDKLKKDNPSGENSRNLFRAVLIEFSKAAAPLIPFISEMVYKDLSKKKESVHLEDFPKKGSINTTLIKEMESVRKIVKDSLELRQRENIKVRQPLNTLFVPREHDVSKFEEIIKDEVNVKNISYSDELKLDTTLTEELKKEGAVRDFIRAIQDERKSMSLSPNDLVDVMVSVEDNLKSVIEEFEGTVRDQSNINMLSFVREDFDNKLKTILGDGSFKINNDS